MEFQKFNKIPRLNRNVIITEKIDGTNAQVFIDFWPAINPENDEYMKKHYSKVLWSDDEMFMMAGSRKRYLSLESDNFGFAQWVTENQEELMGLGPGRHFGEWWGKGIQRNYNMTQRVFSLFNASRWGRPDSERPACCDVVPVLYDGPWIECDVQMQVDELAANGSFATPKYNINFDNPEGVVLFHKQSNHLFKVTCKNDDVPKGMVKS